MTLSADIKRPGLQTLFELANLVINFAHEDIAVYHSIYAQKPSHERQPSCH